MWPFKTTVDDVYRRMGYGIAQKEYFARYVHNIKHWSNHILNTKRFILQSARRCEGRDSAVVLGSGCCIDVPIMELSRMFNKVYFVDLIHPERVKAKIANFSNVQLVVEDLTKMVVETFNSVRQYKDFSVDLLVCSKNYSTGSYSDLLSDFDFVVSVNTLSFLDNLIVDFLVDRQLLDSLTANVLIKDIQQWHVDVLPKGKTCLITPFEEHIYTADHLEFGSKGMLLCQLPHLNHRKEWDWCFSEHLNGSGLEYGVLAGEF